MGLILDARGRPLVLPEDRPTCKRTIDRWVTALDLYPQLDEIIHPKPPSLNPAVP